MPKENCMEREVTLEEMLDARERRAGEQGRLLRTYGVPVVSVCLNTAGPVKNSPLLRRSFQEGLDRLSAALLAAGMDVLAKKEFDQPTGPETLWAVRGDGRELKTLCVELEDQDCLGRLFDMDVLERGHGKWARSELGLSPRTCFICGKPGVLCASRRSHSVETLQHWIRDTLYSFFMLRDRKTISTLAVKALLYEVCTAPKPGLVDRINCGRHRDMDLFTFLDSAAALLPYFEEAAALGQETREMPPQETFRRLRRAGIRAENTMLQATGGVNTHKGAIFSLGIICAGADRLWVPEGTPPETDAVLSECSRMVSDCLEQELSSAVPENATAGQRIYRELGLRGVRGEALEGFPTVTKFGLPALKRALEAGAALEDAGVASLLSLMAETPDTNLLARGGIEGWRWAAEQARKLTAGGGLPARTEVQKLDREMTACGLSPGGCADLLAITFFLHFYAG